CATDIITSCSSAPEITGHDRVLQGHCAGVAENASALLGAAVVRIGTVVGNGRVGCGQRSSAIVVNSATLSGRAISADGAVNDCQRVGVNETAAEAHRNVAAHRAVQQG